LYASRALSLLVALGYFVILALQVARLRRINLMPLLWSFVLATLLLGLLEFTLSLDHAVRTYELASEETRSVLLASGKSAVFWPLHGSLFLAMVQGLLNGIVNCITRPIHGSPKS
jgi:hypothetical protein